MKTVKYRWNTLCLYDYRGVEDHLSAMAAKGWRLEKTGNSFWKYRRAEPARVRYAVTYSDSASQFNPGPTESQQSLEELCAAAGWKKVCDWFQMQIFSTEDEDAVPLETDEALRLENIHRSMRKNFLPSSFVLLALGLLMSASLVYSLISGDIYRLFAQNSRLFTGTMFLLITALEIFTLGYYYRWRQKSRRSVEAGGDCAPVNSRVFRRLNTVGLALVGALTAVYLALEVFSGWNGMVLFFGIYTALLFLLMFLVRRTTALLRKRKASKSVNIAGTLAVDVVLAFALVGGVVYGSLHFGWFFDDGGAEETYEYRGREWDVSPREDLPLTLAELTGERYDHVSRRAVDIGSFFLPERQYSEDALFHDGPKICHLSYSIYEPRFQWLYDATMNHFLKKNTVSGPIYGLTVRYLPEAPAPWGAEAAYRRYFTDTPLNTWLLCYPDRIVVVSSEDIPTEDQKALFAARLGPGT
nr:DUF2812 domain-containing protein [uncultured Oscillibacter sp.]